MSNSMVFEGYAARIGFSSEDECFIGHIAGIKDVVGFHGETVSELKLHLKKLFMIISKHVMQLVKHLKNLIQVN